MFKEGGDPLHCPYLYQYLRIIQLTRSRNEVQTIPQHMLRLYHLSKFNPEKHVQERVRLASNEPRCDSKHDQGKWRECDTLNRLHRKQSMQKTKNQILILVSPTLRTSKKNNREPVNQRVHATPALSHSHMRSCPPTTAKGRGTLQARLLTFHKGRLCGTAGFQRPQHHSEI